eukprot:TRINITY_DN1652_c0_g1_i1.p1 TRINITY_DN1652_c0_g1~~TRINITY_DN1652_c0_g1_i1.p1  ORF type:complete len:421 (+),score=102.97 TRINITY_DN1652_c0_g1_i1:55-1317(+)
MTTLVDSNVFALKCQAQNYDWGQKGEKSIVGRLASTNVSDSSPEKIADKPYAELWMGTHPNAPSYVIQDKEKEEKSLKLRDAIGQDLPFLFKVLSVAKALSIQAHPDKKLAESLHKQKPKLYPDDNHKPELACALTPFEVMCGFRPPEQIAAFLSSVPELNALIGSSLSEQFISAAKENSTNEEKMKPLLKSLFTHVMTPDVNVLKKQLETLITRLKKQQSDEKSNTKSLQDNNIPVDSLILRLNEQYPGDVGIFTPHLLNAFVLQPGEAIFLPANEPHAYLSGDCIECMACSDNVVRAGLTPKFRDTNVLCDMLTYTARRPPIISGKELDSHTRLYSPPVKEFQLSKTSLSANTSYTLQSLPTASIIIAVQGCAFADADKEEMRIWPGRVLFVPKNKSIELKVPSSSSSGLVLFRCFSS